jgi:mannose-1-phosphate guanylyltransferase
MTQYSKGGLHRYCVILAGGDGKRLRQLTQCVSDDARPKQFCPFWAGLTPLRATRHRAARSLDPKRTVFVVTRAHERYYADELADVRPWQVLIQPDNKGTAPAILFSLLHLESIDPGASVVFLPSDHHYGDEHGFLAAVHRAFESAEERAQGPILLAASPTHPEADYGWIEPGPRIETEGRSDLFRVTRFWEKPSLTAARILLNRGCLWNTFVMVGRVGAFIEMIQRAAPHLYDSFERYQTTSGQFDSARLYDTLVPVDFSRDILAQSPARLAVMNTGPVGWSDLGEPERVIRLISQLDLKCDWLDNWRGSRRYAS